MLYYLGKGTQFKKEECKEYKTIEGALRAAAKDETLTVWDENGKIVGGLTDNVPEGALKTNPDGSVPAFDESGHSVGTVDGHGSGGTESHRRERRDRHRRAERGKAGKEYTGNRKRRKWGEYKAGGKQDHHSTGNNESDGHL